MSHIDAINKHMDEHPGSRIGYARLLNRYYPESTVKAWEMRLINHESKGHADAYHYDEANDVYTTTLSFGDITMSGDKHLIKEDKIQGC